MNTIIKLAPVRKEGAAAGAVTYMCDWSIITGNNAWVSLQSVDINRFTSVASPLRSGSHSARIVLKAGDVISGVDRCEVSCQKSDTGASIVKNDSSGTEYQAFSIMFPVNWKPPTGAGAWCLFHQLHGPNPLNLATSIGFNALDVITVEMTYGTDGDSDVDPIWHNYALSKNDLALGHWIDFVIKVKYSSHVDGSLDVWRRDEGETAFTNVLTLTNVPTLQRKSSLPAEVDNYWKTGLYRNSQAVITNIAYLGPVAEGTSFNKVAAAAFGAGAVPVDSPIKQDEVLSIYGAKIFAYWPLLDTSGVVAFDWTLNGHDGAYSNVSLANTPGPMGGLVPLFNGTSSRVNIYSAALAAAFTPELHTLHAVGKGSAGFWTDNANRIMLQLRADLSNRSVLYKNNTNQLVMEYDGGGVYDGQTTAVTPTGFYSVDLTLNKANDRERGYYNGVQVGGDRNTLGTWVGALDSLRCNIGARDNVVNDAYPGWLCEVFVLLDEATAAEIAAVHALMS